MGDEIGRQALCADIGRQALCADCGAQYTTKRRVHRYCSSGCRKNASQRRRRAEEPVNSRVNRDKHRVNLELFDRAIRLTEQYYKTRPDDREDYLRNLLEIARVDARTRAALVNPYVMSEHFPEHFRRRLRGMPLTISQIAREAAWSLWGVSLQEAVYDRSS